jgi:chemotaxis response regulator CheB
MMRQGRTGRETKVLTESGGRRVLIVDDDAGVRAALRVILEVEDFDVVGEAVNGVEAIPRAIMLEPDVVVLDHQMPRRNGEQTAALLREIIPGVQIIAFSAVLDQKPSWADAFLNKTHIVDLAPLVEELIDLRTH